VVIDLRAHRLFARGHLPASHSIPAGELLAGEWPDGDLVLVDAGDGEAQRVREALHAAGYTRQLLHLAGGFPAWQAERLPVSRSGQWAPWGLLLQELRPLQPVCAGAPEQEAFDLLGDTGLLHPSPRLGRA
jgi:rhodanese-related sulfurtransferase